MKTSKKTIKDCATEGNWDLQSHVRYVYDDLMPIDKEDFERNLNSLSETERKEAYALLDGIRRIKQKHNFISSDEHYDFLDMEFAEFIDGIENRMNKVTLMPIRSIVENSNLKQIEAHENNELHTDAVNNKVLRG